MLRPAHMLQLIAVALMGVGVVMIHSAGVSITSPDAGRIGSIFFSRHLAFMALAIVAMLAASRIDVRGMFMARGWKNPLWPLLAVVFGLCVAALVPGVGRNVNGASRWIVVAGVSFQPSELLKYVLPIALAWWCARRQGVMHRFFAGLLPALLLTAAAFVLVGKEDLGTAVLIGVVALAVIAASGARLWQLLLLLPAAGAMLVAGVLAAPYRVKRLMIFLDPWSDTQGAGYHIIQSMAAIAGGGVWGRGLGNGVQKFGYLPEDTTDFIFAIICEELGLAGAMLIIGLYVALIWIGVRVLRECEDTFGRLLALGIVTTIGLQAAMNIAVVTVVVPPKGIALPLVSAGGTGWLVTATAIGLLASLDNARCFAAEKQVARPASLGTGRLMMDH